MRLRFPVGVRASRALRPQFPAGLRRPVESDDPGGPELGRLSEAQMTYIAATKRYETMRYRRSGRSGLQLPIISLGLWHNFGEDSRADNARKICTTAFDQGITHFDLANN